MSKMVTDIKTSAGERVYTFSPSSVNYFFYLCGSKQTDTIMEERRHFTAEQLAGAVVAYNAEPFVIDDVAGAEQLSAVTSVAEELDVVRGGKAFAKAAERLGLDPKSVGTIWKATHAGAEVALFALRDDIMEPEPEIEEQAETEQEERPKRGRPKGHKNKDGHNAGGAREGAGKKALLKHIRQERTRTLQVQLVESTKNKIRAIKQAGFPFEYELEKMVDEWYSLLGAEQEE